MSELEKFEELKQKVLLKYQEQFPFFQGNWKSFSSQDIQNLISLIEEKCKQTISEKWIYTHLKPQTNSKIPRKDMLNILSEFTGFSGWDEFIFEEKVATSIEVKKSKEFKNAKKWLLLLLLPLIFIIVFFYNKKVLRPKTIQLNNEYTNEKVNTEEVKVYKVKDSIKQELEIKEGKVVVINSEDKNTKLVIQSPFYKTKTVNLNSNKNTDQTPTKVELIPDDYAMMLKAFMLSDIKDWEIRKVQLDRILSDDLEVIVMLQNDLGAEYFNKEEFSQMVIIPSKSLKKLRIIDIKNSEDDKIQFIRIIQE